MYIYIHTQKKCIRAFLAEQLPEVTANKSAGAGGFRVSVLAATFSVKNAGSGDHKPYLPYLSHKRSHCACPETKKAHDGSIIEKEQHCGQLTEAHKECMRALGFKIWNAGTSLVVQWFRILLSVQRTWVQSHQGTKIPHAAWQLSLRATTQEPTCPGAQAPNREPTHSNERSYVPQLRLHIAEQTNVSLKKRYEMVVCSGNV